LSTFKVFRFTWYKSCIWVLCDCWAFRRRHWT